MILLSAASASSQEIPRPSLARQRQPEPPSESNIKIGQLFLSADVALGVEYIDNINLTSINPLSDFVIAPELGIAAAWRATELNTLRLRSSFSLQKHLENKLYDRQNLTIAPDSALSFKFYAGDFRIDVHDSFSIQNETQNEASLSGIASLPRFENTAGISLLWDLNDITWMIGYDHYNFITLGSALFSNGAEASDLSLLDHSTDSISTSVQLRINDALRPGLESAVTYTDYPDEAIDDFGTFIIGPFVNVQLTRYTSAYASVGFKTYKIYPGDLSPTIDFKESDDLEFGYYANFAIAHRLNRFYSDRFDFGHEDESDALSGRTETNYIRYSALWTAGRRVSVTGQLSFEDIRQTSGILINTSQSTSYLRYGAAISATYYLSDSSSIGLTYQFIKQDTDSPVTAYEQNRIYLRFAHRF